MAIRRTTVVFGFLGNVLDAGAGPRRWDHWRPTVGLCRQDDLEVGRFVLLCQARDQQIAKRVADDIATVSPATQVQLVTTAIADPWDFATVYAALLDVVRAYPFDPEREDYLAHITTGTHVGQICMFLLVESREIPGRLVQTAPPPKHANNLAGRHVIIDLDLSKYDVLAQRFGRDRAEGLSFLKAGIETVNPEFNALIEQIERVAIRSRAPVLLTGPTGAGKSQLARRIYELKKSRRQVQGEFVAVNCATLRGDGAMSALFGHVRGAFTGAAADRAGYLKKAHNGVLFLDEIGELGADEQAMLLHAVEEHTFYPVGSDKEIRSEFQLIAGTNRELRGEVTRGNFRADLLARIDLWTFALPGLRDRRDDIEPNVEHELARSTERLGTRVMFSREARARYMSFAVSDAATWAGNFRDLDASVTRMATLAEGGRITVGVVNEEIVRLERAWREGDTGNQGDDRVRELLGNEAASALDRFDRVQLADVLGVCRSARSLSEAGRVLFAASRARKTSSNDADRLRKHLARFGLEWERVRG